MQNSFPYNFKEGPDMAIQGDFIFRIFLYVTMAPKEVMEKHKKTIEILLSQSGISTLEYKCTLVGAYEDVGSAIILVNEHHCNDPRIRKFVRELRKEGYDASLTTKIM